ncbi:MAG: class I SAM-dependent methyltransferase [Okeania sp. SIO2C2]|uniref:class I SAM-dependent methyltransferase n=1 Tax=Okeania sp. SIO2C2 TaxID=2607787 RepID=UPI0013B9CBE9|nr:class I SAM-dependent methyltransferase [Okeania sp. SIO2C2]NEP87200.1 class I SAM-dependent methyltransferase [Okeania sp. SIO2C2]
MNNYYDKIAHLYDATRPLPKLVSEKITDCILQLVEATPQTKFLELGIGTGRTGYSIVQRGYSYTGIDISQEMIEQLCGKFSKMPENLTLLQGDASTLPFENNFFDVVLTVHVLHCLQDPLAGLNEIRRVLKPNGVYLSCENLISSYQKNFENILRKILSQYQLESSQKSASKIETKPNFFGEGMRQLLLYLGATVETVTAARWQQSHTVAELFGIYHSRAFGICWSVPDEVFSIAMQEFKECLKQYYNSFEEILYDEVKFNITVVHNFSKLSTLLVEKI